MKVESASANPLHKPFIHGGTVFRTGELRRMAPTEAATCRQYTRNVLASLGINDDIPAALQALERVQIQVIVDQNRAREILRSQEFQHHRLLLGPRGHGLAPKCDKDDTASQATPKINLGHWA
ncbi:MAG: hypothetical protein ACREDY_01825 [Bradyrhizobium sp.]